MNEKDRLVQVKRAKANYELTKLLFNRKQASADQLEAAREQVLKWEGSSLELFKPTKEELKERIKYLPENDFQHSLSGEVKSIIDNLEAERTAIDQQKKRLSMQLATIPDDVSAQKEVNDILFLRDKWQELTDKIKYVYQFGKLPEAPEQSVFDEHAFASGLPNSKYELDKEIRNLSANLSKYKKRLETSGTQIKKQHYLTLIAQAELKISVMRAKFNHL